MQPNHLAFSWGPRPSAKLTPETTVAAPSPPPQHPCAEGPPPPISCPLYGFIKLLAVLQLKELLFLQL